MTFCAIGLTNAKLYEKSLMESRRSRVSKSLKFDWLISTCLYGKAVARLGQEIIRRSDVAGPDGNQDNDAGYRISEV